MLDVETKMRAFFDSLQSFSSNEAAAAVLAVGRPYWLFGVKLVKVV